MPANWEIFENKATKFLNNKYNKKGFAFKNVGGNDSNKPDIKVYKNKKHIFNIEAKYSPSQAGQFVIKNKKNKFIFSSKNKIPNNKHSKTIIDFINENYNKYKDVGTASLKINYTTKKPFYKWVINHYQKHNNSHFIITSDKYKNIDFIALVPILKLEDFFDVKANLRRKRSGTSHLPKSERNQVKKLIKKHLSQLEIKLEQWEIEGKKTFITLNKKLRKDHQYFGNKNYYLSNNPIPQKKYSIKKRSMTNNINIIFSLVYTGIRKNIGYENFEKYMNTY